MNKILEYINKGIEHYQTEIDNLGMDEHSLKRSKTASFYYGAQEALVNLKKFIESIDTNTEVSDAKTLIVPKDCIPFEGIFPVEFKYEEGFYRTLIDNKTPICTVKDGVQTIVGECNTAIKGNLIYVKGDFYYKDINPNKLPSITLSILEKHPLYIMSDVGEINYRIIK